MAKDCIGLLLHDAGKEPLINRDDLARLIHAAQKGDVEARNRVVENNLKLVIFFAKKLQNCGMPIEDLIQEGTLGLMHAVSKFNPERGVKFSTYSSYWIFQSMMNAIAEKVRTIRLPIYVSQRLKKMRAIEEDLYRRTGDVPTVDDTIRKMGLSKTSADALKRAMAATVSIHSKSEEDENELAISVKDDNRAEVNEDLDAMRDAMKRLSGIQRQVIHARFIKKDKQTLEQIGKKFCLTRERIRQIGNEAIGILRGLLESPNIE